MMCTWFKYVKHLFVGVHTIWSHRAPNSVDTSKRCLTYIYLATSPPQAVRSRRMKQVILEVDKTQLVVRGVQQPTLYSKKKQRPRSTIIDTIAYVGYSIYATIMEKKLAFAVCIKKIGLQEMTAY